MEFQRVEDALRVLEDITLDSAAHEEAVEFLYHMNEDEEIEQLVEALRNDDFGIRWEAADLLSLMGRRAFPAILEGLLDPVKAGDSRFRESIYHILHLNHDVLLKVDAAPLIQALKGPAADLNAMQEAHRLLMKERVRSRYKKFR